MYYKKNIKAFNIKTLYGTIGVLFMKIMFEANSASIFLQIFSDQIK